MHDKKTYEDAAAHEKYHRSRTNGEACEDTSDSMPENREPEPASDEEVARYTLNSATDTAEEKRKERSKRIAKEHLDSMKKQTAETVARDEEEARIREMREKMKRMAGTDTLGGNYDTPPER